jgi:hypothetical protein
MARHLLIAGLTAGAFVASTAGTTPARQQRGSATLDERIAPLHEELRPFRAADPRVLWLGPSPGIGELYNAGSQTLRWAPSTLRIRSRRLGFSRPPAEARPRRPASRSSAPDRR